MTVHENAASPTPTVEETSSARAGHRAPRRGVRAGLSAGAVTAGLMLGSWAVSAAAAPPEGWENATNDSMLTSMLKLFGIPIAVIAVVTLLTYLPLIMRGGRKGTDPSGWFAEHSEWFGGPRTTPEALEHQATQTQGQLSTRGGASARY